MAKNFVEELKWRGMLAQIMPCAIIKRIFIINYSLS